MKRRRFVAQIDKDKCTECGKCKRCSKINNSKRCSGCGKCLTVCPVGAISLVERAKEDKISSNKFLKYMWNIVKGNW
jgi:MinD superfamily P-loop ATPase containing an inserted ferredoxin domain